MTTLEAILFESDDENIPQYVGPQANVENEILLQNGESHLTTPVDFKSPLKPANSPPLPPPLPPPPPPPPPPLLLPPPLPPSCDRAFLEHYCHSLDGQNDEPPLGGSNLILKIERFAETFNNIMGSLNLERSTVNSTLQDIKSSAKIDVQMFFAAKNSLTTEFSKLETIWHLRHPEEAYAFEMKDLSHAIARQNRLTTSVDN